MCQIQAYERDPYLKGIDAEVLSVGILDGQPFAVLSDTIFFSEGGGQPSDRGLINGISVTGVQKVDGEIRHLLSNPVALGPARLELDWSRRFDHMQQHTAQHLLTALAQDRFGWATTAFHLGEDRCDIELDVPSLKSESLALLEACLAQEIRASSPIWARRVSPDEYAGLKVRSRGLPSGHIGEIRLVEIEGLDLNTCGGTHLRQTGEIETIVLLGTESVRGGTRLYFVAGGRVRDRLAAHESRNAALRTLLGAPDAELIGVLEARLERIRQSERQIRLLEEELASCLVASLSAGPETLMERHFEHRDVGFIQKLGRSLVAAAPAKVAFLTAESASGATFVLAAGRDAVLDVPAVGRIIAERLEAKGGGFAGFFQGKIGHLAGRAEALEYLRSLIPSA